MFYVCLYVYENSNFGGFRIPHVYVYAHKWLEHLASATSGIRNERAMERACFFLNGIKFFHQGNMVLILTLNIKSHCLRKPGRDKRWGRPICLKFIPFNSHLVGIRLAEYELQRAFTLRVDHPPNF